MGVLELLLVNGSKGQRTTENFLKQRLKEFEKKENIQVRIKLISWHRAYENIVSSFKSSNSPDVFQVGSSWVSSLAYLNYLKVINDYQDDKTLLACWMDGCCHFQGERVGVPWIIDSEIMVARNDIIQKVGLDIKKLNTWEEFYQAHLRLNQYRRLDSSFPKVMSFAIRPDLNTLHRFISWYFANGYDVPDLNSKEILATSNIIEVFQYFRSLIEISDVDLSDVDKHPYQGNEDFYNKGSYVFYLGNWYGVIMKVLGQSNYINDELELVPMNIPSKNSRIGTHGGGSVLAVSSQSKYPDKARKLLEFLSSVKFGEDWMYATACMSVYENSFWKRRYYNKTIDTLYQLVSNSRTFPFNPAWCSIENILVEGISRCMWKLFKKDFDIDTDIIYLLKEIDQAILKINNMSWEMSAYAY